MGAESIVRLCRLAAVVSVLIVPSLVFTQRLTIDIGQPSIWSLGQAHYLLANMHQENRALRVPMPTDALNPSSINAARLDMLRSVFSAELQSSQPQGSQNRISLERYATDFERRQMLRQALDGKRAQLETVSRDLIVLNQQLATMQANLAAEGAAAPAPPPNAALQADIARAKADVAARTSERDLLNTEITAISTEERALALSTPTLTAPAAGAAAAMPDDLSTILGKSLDKIGSPSVNASTALDNFVQMQYEVIAKQLTLLRDEIGPDERLVFLELPASIYSVPGKDDNYIAQIKWRVTQLATLDVAGAVEDHLIPPLTLEIVQAQRTPTDKSASSRSTVNRRLQEFEASMQRMKASWRIDWFNLPDDPGQRLTGPPKGGNHETRPDRNPFPGLPTIPLAGGVGRETLVRALDVIPRQSALNVNDHHATQRGFNLGSVFQFLTGVGAKVSYQRQRSIYEQFVHQEIFASGFGKGQTTFGWTFGPLPGTKRLAPGIRTTYAVLAVPRTAVALRLRASGFVYKRDRDPADHEPVTDTEFDVLVPGEWTNGFWLQGVAYSPVPRGQRVVVLLQGDQFSPQLGVLVNGVPLRRAVSIGRNESDRVSAVAGANGIEGEYEHLGADAVVLSFSMGDKYVGTPTITLVAPGKTSSINSFPLQINYRPQPRSLREVAKEEPMFTEPLEVKKVVPLPNPAAGPPRIRVTGTGFRPDARFTLNDVAPLATVQTSTEAYELTLSAPLGSKTVVRVEQPTKQGLEVREIVHQIPQASATAKVIEFQPSRGSHAVRASLELTVPGSGVFAIDQSPEHVVERTVDLGNNVFLVTLRATSFDFLLTASRGSANSLHRIVIPAAPSIIRVQNLRTGESSATAEQETEVSITGRHLRNVKRVIFGSAAATLIGYGATSDVLIVRAPALPEGRVQVTLETDLEYRGIPVSNAGDFAGGATNAYFTYVKKR